MRIFELCLSVFTVLLCCCGVLQQICLNLSDRMSDSGFQAALFVWTLLTLLVVCLMATTPVGFTH